MNSLVRAPAGYCGAEEVTAKMSSKDRVTVASERADFIADRIALGVPAPENEVRDLARLLREIAFEIGVGPKRPGVVRPFSNKR
jgi:hypothetical protein